MFLKNDKNNKARFDLKIKFFLFFIIGLLVSVSIASLEPDEAYASTFSIQTGYYIGTGVTGNEISGLGFQPEFAMVKSSTTAGVAVFKTDSMPASNVAYTSATSNNTATQLTFTSDGFSVGTLANLNTTNTLYYYIAVRGSDCSASGTFCTGTYTGNGSASRSIPTGFDPSMVMVKRSTAVSGHFRVSAQPANETLFADTTARNTAGAFIASLGTGSFNVGILDNTNVAIYYFFAFKETAGAFDQGSYTGNGTDNRSITGVGFQPNFVMVKNATSATAANQNPLINFTQSYGQPSPSLGATTAAIVNGIQALQSDGFQLGTSVRANENTQTHYYFAIGGASSRTSSGTFSMKVGSFTGTGVAGNAITGVGFKPDLVIIKASTAQQGVFRTRTMAGDSTQYLGVATAPFANGITSLNADGFTLGSSAISNSSTVVYYYEAFGGAFNPYDNSGASDFAVGTYYGTGVDNRNIRDTPWQPDFVLIGRNAASGAAWRSSSMSGDNASFLSGVADTANVIQSFNSDGFQVGTNASTNTSARLHHYFAFKAGANFKVGTYTGNALTQNITSVGFQPDYVIIKSASTGQGIQRPSSLTGNSTQYIANVANIVGRVTTFLANGFTLGAGSYSESNVNAIVYRYIAWKVPSTNILSVDLVNASNISISNPNLSMTANESRFICTASSGTLGSSSQKIRVDNPTSTPGWTLNIASTGGLASLWQNTGATRKFDFNDPTSSGCVDGPDTDLFAGSLDLDPTNMTITPGSGCSASNINKGAQADFEESVIDAITLAAATSSADTNCFWDITAIDIVQTLPPELAADNYTINLTLTIVAS